MTDIAPKIRAVADRHRGPMARRVLIALASWQRKIDIHAVETLLHNGPQGPSAVGDYVESLQSDMEIGLRTAAIFDDSRDNLARGIMNVMDSSARATQCSFSQFMKKSGPVRTAAKNVCLTAFDKANPEVVAWAKKRSATLVTEITKESQRAIRNVVARSISEGIPPSDAAKIIQKSVSLTERQADAVVNLRQTLIKSPGDLVMAGKTRIRVPVNGMDAARLQREVSKYADRLLKQRAILIARTETIAASNEGQTQLWKQAIAKGELDPNLKRVWIAAMSERTCPQCSSLDGQTVGMNESWGGIDNPPAHPACRCTTGLVAA